MDIDWGLRSEADKLGAQIDLIDQKINEEKAKLPSLKSLAERQAAWKKIKEHYQERGKLSKKQRIIVDSELPKLARAWGSKRIRDEFVDYHYSNVLKLHEVVKSPGILCAELTNGSPEYINSPAFCAEVFALLHNLHVLFDSIPYILNLAIRKFDIDYRRLYWSEEVIEKYQPTTGNTFEAELHQKLSQALTNKTISDLKKLINSGKHAYLRPMFYDPSCEEVIFDQINYGDINKPLPPIKVIQFIEDAHNEILPMINELFKAIQAVIEDKYGKEVVQIPSDQ